MARRSRISPWVAMPPAGENGAERVQDRLLAPARFADTKVRDEAEQRPAPVGAAPSGRAVEALIPRPGLALGNLSPQIGPEGSRRLAAIPKAQQRLQVGGDAFFKPVVGAIEIGQRGVDQLVGENPIVGEILIGDGSTQ